MLLRSAIHRASGESAVALATCNGGAEPADRRERGQGACAYEMARRQLAARDRNFASPAQKLHICRRDYPGLLLY